LEFGPRSFRTYLPTWVLTYYLPGQGLDSIRVRSQFPIFYPSFQINIFSLLLAASYLPLSPPCQQLTNRLDVILGFGPCQSCQTGNLAGTWSPFLGSANYRSAPNVQYSRSALRCGNAKYTVEAVSFSNTTLRPYHTIIGTIQYGTGRYLQPPPGLFWPQAWKHQEPHRHLSIFVARGGIIFCSYRNSTSNSPHPRLQ
jgi:hypothetical protein